jgi:inositol phosphorylceramide mannosyltransferase catalytic subunit
MKRFFALCSFVTLIFASVPIFSSSSTTTIGTYFASWPTSYTNKVPNGHWSKQIKMSKNLFEAWRRHSYTPDKKRIPPIIHFIWLGSPLPLSCQQIIQSWKKYHPNWLIIVWTDEEAKVFPFQNRAAFDAAKNFGEKSDIFRYEILYRYGGIYADTDEECFKPFDTLASCSDFFVGLIDDHFLGIGIIGTKAKHPIMKYLLDNIAISTGDNHPGRITATTGPIAFTKYFFKISAKFKGKATVLPPNYFYPFTLTDHFKYKNYSIEEIRTFIKPETMAIHYWNASWMVHKQIENHSKK